VQRLLGDHHGSASSARGCRHRIALRQLYQRSPRRSHPGLSNDWAERGGPAIVAHGIKPLHCGLAMSFVVPITEAHHAKRSKASRYSVLAGCTSTWCWAQTIEPLPKTNERSHGRPGCRRRPMVSETFSVVLEGSVVAPGSAYRTIDTFAAFTRRRSGRARVRDVGRPPKIIEKKLFFRMEYARAPERQALRANGECWHAGATTFNLDAKTGAGAPLLAGEPSARRRTPAPSQNHARTVAARASGARARASRSRPR
jgi:hypothetical protein